MPTPRFKSRPAVKNKSPTDWKDHPLSIAVAVAVGTSVFFMTVVIPLRVDLLTAKVERLTELSANALSISNELEYTKRELSETYAALQANLQNSPFQGKSVYPIGFDAVVIGTDKDDVVSRYPNGKWNEGNTYYSVKSKVDGIIRAATYYYKDEKVSMILFYLEGGKKAGTDIVIKHFLATFGEPNATLRKEVFWKATDREWVTVDAEVKNISGSYIVSASSSEVLLLKFGLREPSVR